MKYYLWNNETQEGPYEDWEILKKLRDGEITRDTVACEEGSTNSQWIKVSEITAIHFSVSPASKRNQKLPNSIASFSDNFSKICLFGGAAIAILIAITYGHVGAPFAISIFISCIVTYSFFCVPC